MFKKLKSRLPNRPLTNLDLTDHSRNIPYFRGVFMKDRLPIKPKRIECGIVNLDNSDGIGTHWVAYIKVYNYCEYYDSYGDLRPPLELVRYFNNCNVYYNYVRYQKCNTVLCGHFCLKFLQNFWNKNNKT